MAGITLTDVSKIYDDGTRAVSDLNLDAARAVAGEGRFRAS